MNNLKRPFVPKRFHQRLEYHSFTTSTSWFETKQAIIHPAIQQFLAEPKALLCGYEQATRAHKRATA
jgi:hypothetical protein